jgi:hypothetical protein
LGLTIVGEIILVGPFANLRKAVAKIENSMAVNLRELNGGNWPENFAHQMPMLEFTIFISVGKFLWGTVACFGGGSKLGLDFRGRATCCRQWKEFSEFLEWFCTVHTT